jgi:hypothetical protein
MSLENEVLDFKADCRGMLRDVLIKTRKHLDTINVNDVSKEELDCLVVLASEAVAAHTISSMARGLGNGYNS